MSNPAAAASARLRIAVAASDAAAESRFVSLVAQLGHELVLAEASPDVWLTDGVAAFAPTALVVVVGSSAEKVAGQLSANATARQIDAALRAVAAGLTVRAASRQSCSFEPLPEEAAAVLTPREIDVLTALSKGLSNKAVARRLGISPHTVKFHVDSLFRKLGAASRAEAGRERPETANRRALTTIVFVGRGP